MTWEPHDWQEMRNPFSPRSTTTERAAGPQPGPSAGARAGARSVTLISRVDCHLCEVAEATLTGLQRELGFALEKLDVDADPDRRNEYSDRVPVILIDGREHGYWRVEEKRFRAALER